MLHIASPAIIKSSFARHVTVLGCTCLLLLVFFSSVLVLVLHHVINRNLRTRSMLTDWLNFIIYLGWWGGSIGGGGGGGGGKVVVVVVALLLLLLQGLERTISGNSRSTTRFQLLVIIYCWLIAQSTAQDDLRAFALSNTQNKKYTTHWKCLSY